jgi:alcohol dehydrogenase
VIGALELRWPARVLIGPGESKRLGEVATSLGTRALLVTGGRSLESSGNLVRLQESLRSRGVDFVQVRTSGEPDVAAVDTAAATGRKACCDLVVAIGGGSALDLGKAAAALIPNEGSVQEYLEGVGTGRTFVRPPYPFIAVPTTAGTGSEATKNAVISGPGFKKSLRDPRMVPLAAIVDAVLMVSCTPEVTAAVGMDALTQLVESLTSLNAHPLTSTLALHGIEAVRSGLPEAVAHPDDLAAREWMAYASFLSGITLSHAGLGAVHGLASPIGALCTAPHANICARLLRPVTRANITALGAGRGMTRALGAYRLVQDSVEDLTGRFTFPGLAHWGMTEADFPRVLAGATGGSMKTNPVALTPDELAGILRQAL